MYRRQFLASSLLVATGVGVGIWQLPRVSAVISLSELGDYLQELPVDQLVSESAFSAAQAFIHCAQSIDYSIDGYPALKPKWFRQSIGKMAWELFAMRDGSRHNVAEPIPGAPVLPIDSIASDARAQLLASMQRFERFQGEHPTHFAYGSLNHTQYAKAHVMHIVEHLSVMRLS